MHHFLAQPEVGIALYSVAVYLLARQRYAQFISQHPVIRRATSLPFAFAHAPQVNIADGTVDNFRAYDLFIYMMRAVVLFQLANHASHNARRPRSLHNDGPVTLYHLRAQCPHKRTLLGLGTFLICERGSYIYCVIVDNSHTFPSSCAFIAQSTLRLAVSIGCLLLRSVPHFHVV